jgi:two-component system, NtrC family, response regulator HydG
MMIEQIMLDSHAPDKPNLLIVEDDFTLRQLLCEELRVDLDCHVFGAKSLQEAIKILNTDRVTVVLSDYCMPDGTGIDLLDWIKQHGSQKPPVILMTGISGSELQEISNKGAAAIVIKPFEWNTIIAQIKTVLDKSTAELSTLLTA